MDKNTTLMNFFIILHVLQLLLYLFGWFLGFGLHYLMDWFYNVLLFNYNKICFLNAYVFSVNLQHYNNLCIRIFINNVVKCTKMYSLLPQNTLFSNDKRKTIIKFDEVKYFSVQVMLTFSSKYKNKFVSNVLINCIFGGDRKQKQYLFTWYFIVFYLCIFN